MDEVPEHVLDEVAEAAMLSRRNRLQLFQEWRAEPDRRRGSGSAFRYDRLRATDVVDLRLFQLTDELAFSFLPR